MKQTYCIFALVAMTAPALADAPVLQNSGPIIYLADNLDEKDQLGWCIDTLGRGQSDAIQAHSCKPDSTDSRNRDVLFTYDEASGRIAHAEYEGVCLTVNDEGAETELGLLACSETAASQAFSYDTATLEIHPAGDASLCLTAGAESRQAGPYMSRSLGLEPCADVDATLRSWSILAAQ